MSVRSEAGFRRSKWMPRDLSLFGKMKRDGGLSNPSIRVG